MCRKKEEKTTDICFLKMATKERIKKYSIKTIKKCIPYIKLKEYTETIQINPEEAKDYLIYGIQAEKLEEGKKVEVVVYSSDFNASDLVVLDKVLNTSETIDLRMLMDISFWLKEDKFRSYVNYIDNKSGGENKSKKRFSCFGSSAAKNSSNNNGNANNVKKSKKISCLGGNRTNINNNKNEDKRKEENINDKTKNKNNFYNNNINNPNINNNDNIINNPYNNKILHKNNSPKSNGSIENNKQQSNLNINSSQTQNTVPDNNNNKNNKNNEFSNKGRDSSNRSEWASAAKRYISLIKSAGEKLNLLFKSEHELKAFAITLLNIFEPESSEAEEKPSLNVFEKHLKKIWYKFDLNQTEFLDFQDFHKMIKLLDQSYHCIFSVNLKEEKAIKSLFQKLAQENKKKISFDEFFKFYNEIIAGLEFEEVFLSFSKGKQLLNYEDLSQFIVSEQKQVLKSDEIASIFLDYKIEIAETPRNPESGRLKADKADNSDSNKLSKFSNNKHREKEAFQSVVVNNKINIGSIDYKLNLMEFKNFISDKSRCCIFDLDAFEVQHDMSRPLNEYFVFSSHKTFLNKNIYGEGSLEMYNYAINEGCRMLELECYVILKIVLT